MRKVSFLIVSFFMFFTTNSFAAPFIKIPDIHLPNIPNLPTSFMCNNIKEVKFQTYVSSHTNSTYIIGGKTTNINNSCSISLTVTRNWQYDSSLEPVSNWIAAGIYFKVKNHNGINYRLVPTNHNNFVEDNKYPIFRPSGKRYFDKDSYYETVIQLHATKNPLKSDGTPYATHFPREHTIKFNIEKQEYGNWVPTISKVVVKVYYKNIY